MEKFLFIENWCGGKLLFIALLRVYRGEEFGEFFKRPRRPLTVLAVFVGANIVRPLLGRIAE